MKSPTPVSDSQLLADALVASKRQPVWHVLVLSTLTCFGYVFYWFYKTWRDLQRHAAALSSGDQQTEGALDQFKKVSPLLRTIGLLIPVWHIYLSLSLFKGIAEIYPEPGALPRRRPLFVAALLVGFIVGCMYLKALPGSWYLLSFLGILPIVVLQSWLNKYWQTVEPPAATVRYAFSIGEIVVIIAGSLLLGLVVTSFFILP